LGFDIKKYMTNCIVFGYIFSDNLLNFYDKFGIIYHNTGIFIKNTA